MHLSFLKFLPNLGMVWSLVLQFRTTSSYIIFLPKKVFVPSWAFFWKKCSHTLGGAPYTLSLIILIETIVHNYNKISILIPNNSVLMLAFLIWDFILFLVLLRLFLNKLAGFFKVPRNPIPWLVSVLVETETGQSTDSCMSCHLSQKMPYHYS